MYAIIVAGGKQYKVAEGDTIYIEKMEVNDGDAVKFDNVLVVEKDGNVTVGAPYVEGASVSGKVVKNGKSKKITVFKFKAKKNYRRHYTAALPIPNAWALSVRTASSSWRATSSSGSVAQRSIPA